MLKRPADKREQIVEGKVKKQLTAEVLLEQPFVKDETITVGKLIDDVIRKTGENIVVRRFTRYALGEVGSPVTGGRSAPWTCPAAMTSQPV